MPLIDAAKQIALLEQQQRSLLLSFVESPATTLEEYRERVGKYQGLNDAREYIKRGTNDEDDDGEAGVARAPQRTGTRSGPVR